MFCPHCGSQIADHALFCGRCGKNIPQKKTVSAHTVPVVNQSAGAESVPTVSQSTTPAVSPVFATEQGTPNSFGTSAEPFEAERIPLVAPPVSESVPSESASKPVSKHRYLFKLAPASNRLYVALIWILCLLCVGCLGLSAYRAVAEPFFEIPAIEWTMEAVDVSLQDDLAEYGELFDRIEQRYAEIKDTMTADEREAAKEYLALRPYATGEFSMMDAMTFEEKAEALAERLPADMADNAHMIRGAFDDLEDETGMSLTDFFSMLMVCVIAACVLVAVVLLLATLLKLNSLVSIAMVLAMVVVFPFGGLILGGVTMVLFVTIMVFVAMLNQSYKRYCRSL